MKSGGYIALGLAVALVLYNRKRIIGKPKILISEDLPAGYNAVTVPPFGIFVKRNQAGNEKLLQHEQIHWKQYQQMGLIPYYLNYATEKIRYGYDRMPMEIEARECEDDYPRFNYTECVRNGTAQTIQDPDFRI